MARIDYDDFTEYFPAFICIVLTIFSFNSGNGVAAALIAYAFLKLVSGRVLERALEPLRSSIFNGMLFLSISCTLGPYKVSY